MSLVLISWMKFVVQDSHFLNLNLTNDNLMKKFLKCWLLMAIITSFGMMIIILHNHIILKIDIRLWRYWLISSLLFVFFSPLRLTPNPVIWSHLSFFFSLSSFQTLVKTKACFLWQLVLSQSMCEGTYPIFFSHRAALCCLSTCWSYSPIFQNNSKDMSLLFLFSTSLFWSAAETYSFFFFP